MTTFAAVTPTGSTNNKQIKVHATSGTGTTVHQVTTGKTAEITIKATNTSASAVLLTLQWGGTTDPDNLTKITVNPQIGDLLVKYRSRLTGNLTVTAIAATADVIMLDVSVDEF